jgi:transcriptional regulator GlxA family with amidase domain
MQHSSEQQHHVRPRSVHRAINFMTQLIGEPISLNDIAAASQVPERTLLQAFKVFEGTSPMQFLRGLRLENARQYLSGRGGARCVAEAAARAGFSHSGRFAQYYEERFGENPSATLRRARSMKL